MTGPPDGCPIFRPVAPNQGLATLLLIENSQEMVPMWPDLRDRHLPTLIGAMRLANPVAEIKILMLTSSPVDEHTSTATGPREYYELPEVQFHLHPDNRLSAATINRATDLLASTGRGEQTARHIVIVAASTPADDGSSKMGHVDPNARLGWQLLARKFMQADIHCHMVLNPNQNMNAFTELFYDTLYLQTFEEVAPWFPTGDNYVFHLSARPINPISGLTLVGSPGPCMAQFAGQPSLSQHNFTVPPEVHTSNIVEDLSVHPESRVDVSTPSLVTRLQQAHGLTKKKIYGVRPNRQPFFRDDHVREKYRRAPTPLAIPTFPSGARTHRDVDTTHRSRSDHRRLGDLSQAGSVSPRSSTVALPQWPPRGSQLPSPETDTSLSSPASLPTYGTLSPVSPLMPTYDHFSSSVSSPITPATDDVCNTNLSIEHIEASPVKSTNSGARILEPTWLDNQYLSGIQPLSPPMHTIPPIFHGDYAVNDMGITSKALPPPSHPSTYDQPALTDPGAGLGPSFTGRRRSNPGELMPSASLSQLATTFMDDVDRPFIFPPDEEVAAPAHASKALHSSSHIPTSLERKPAIVTSSSTMMPSYPPNERPSHSLFPSAPTAPALRRPIKPEDDYAYCADVTNPNRSQGPSFTRGNSSAAYAYGSSSLTGWAG